MWSAFTRAVAGFRSAGATVVERDPGWFSATSHHTIMAFDLADTHRERFIKLRFDYRPTVAGLIEQGILTTKGEYDRASRAQEEAIAKSGAMMRDVDALICPAARGPAPDPSTTGDALFNSRWTYSGQPTITIPMELTPDGLPLGIQLIGQRFDEAMLFRAAAWCEAALPGLKSSEEPNDRPEKPPG